MKEVVMICRYAQSLSLSFQRPAHFCPFDSLALFVCTFVFLFVLFCVCLFVWLFIVLISIGESQPQSWQSNEESMDSTVMSRLLQRHANASDDDDVDIELPSISATALDYESLRADLEVGAI